MSGEGWHQAHLLPTCGRFWGAGQGCLSERKTWGIRHTRTACSLYACGSDLSSCMTSWMWHCSRQECTWRIISSSLSFGSLSKRRRASRQVCRGMTSLSSSWQLCVAFSFALWDRSTGYPLVRPGEKLLDLVSVLLPRMNRLLTSSLPGLFALIFVFGSF